MSDEFFDQVGKDFDTERLSLCPTIVRDGDGTRQCRLVLTNRPLMSAVGSCFKCAAKIRVCDCERQRVAADACDRRHCPRLSE